MDFVVISKQRSDRWKATAHGFGIQTATDEEKWERKLCVLRKTESTENCVWNLDSGLNGEWDCQRIISFARLLIFCLDWRMGRSLGFLLFFYLFCFLILSLLPWLLFLNKAKKENARGRGRITGGTPITCCSNMRRLLERLQPHSQNFHSKVSTRYFSW